MVTWTQALAICIPLWISMAVLAGYARRKRRGEKKTRLIKRLTLLVDLDQARQEIKAEWLDSFDPKFKHLP